jgi:Fic family protein
MVSVLYQEVLAEAYKRPRSRRIVKPRDARLSLLTNICIVLHERFHGNPFYLSTPDAAAMCGVSVATAWNDLKRLCDEGVLKKVKAGTREEGEANEWQYICKVS